ncbi:MAG: hypothetical protein DI530_12255 [Sphingomonas sp.]|uniref:hypothetical protein n=1 Tax=Sphingomonas sp. TaxID=28214 RepID=UPI000DBBFA81|nr:hypothetical protein [Sphingomonas sp.]PZU77757.1 MAG: hypothetical protein DI530_12255 [Sphingomonas sp.]
MSKVLKTAAIVVGAVALVATGIGAVAGAGIGLGLSTSTLATIATVGKVATVAGAALSIGAMTTAKPPPVTGNQTAFSANPDDGMPLILGRMACRGSVRWRASP